MTALLLIALTALALIRWPWMGGRQTDMIQFAGVFGLSGILIGNTAAGSALDSAVKLPDVSCMLMMSCLLVSLWCAKCAVEKAVRGRRSRRGTGLPLLVLSGITCWAIFFLSPVIGALDPAGATEQGGGYSPAIHFVIAFLYAGVVTSGLAGWSGRAAARARTWTVRIGCGLISCSAAVLGASLYARAGIGGIEAVRLWVGSGQDSNAARLDAAASVAMQYSGFAAAVGLILPSVPPFSAYLKEAAWGLRTLRVIKPLWRRAAAERGDRLTGIFSVHKASPVARLHRCVVEIRDAQLAQALDLTPREAAMLSAAEARLSYDIKEATR